MLVAAAVGGALVGSHARVRHPGSACRCAMFSKPEEYTVFFDTHAPSATAEQQLVEAPELPLTFGAGTFSTAEELRGMLRARGCDVDAWGAEAEGRATKTVDELWEEIEMGECDLRIDRDGIRRQLSVVKVRVRGPSGAAVELVEASQIFSDGRTRKRGLPLSEKMFPGEKPLDAAERGIVEELGSAIREKRSLWPIELVEDSVVEWAETRTSKSYPDLLSHYSLFQVDAVVHGLPSESFSTVEYDDRCTTTLGGPAIDCQLKLAHTWDWVALLSIQPSELDVPNALDAASMAEEGSLDADTTYMYVSDDRSFSVVQQGARSSRSSERRFR